MPRPLQILHLEDSRIDHELVRHVVVQSGLACEFVHVGGRTDYETALARGGCDLILADYTLPDYNGPAALSAAQSLQPDTPFVFVSGSIGEERAVESLKHGATDYILKDRLNRLPAAIHRALREATERLRRKQAEAALQQSEARFREMAETIRDVFWMTDADCRRRIYASPAYAQVWGCSSSELGSDPTGWLIALAAEDRASAEDALRQLADGGLYRATYRILRADGTERWIEDRGFPVFDDRHRLVRAVGVAVDVTERRQLEAQFQQSQKLETIGRLAGGMAHDFNNILTVVLGQVSFLLDHQPLQPATVEALELVYTASDRAAGLIRQWLLFSRNRAPRREPVNLNTAVEEITAMLRRLLGETISVTVESSPQALWIVAENGMIEQVLMNLAVNARDAMPRGGKLTLHLDPAPDSSAAPASATARPGHFARLAVSDTGAGISADVLPRLFEPFFTTKPEGHGTGLGLTLVKTMVERHGGWVEVESRLQAGTTFAVFLPRMDPPPAETSLTMTETTAGRGHETILLVEDDTNVREFAAAMLQRLGYAVLQAKSGDQALAVWHRHAQKISLLLTDVVLPGDLSGVALLSRLQTEKPDLKAVIVSGYPGETVDKVPASVRFLHKPYLPKTLAQAVRAALDNTS
ncbi:MAG: response regulator [Verrucomicrobia bacterium]|nr:response regulator [Verrucomicrobiota bacterium]